MRLRQFNNLPESEVLERLGTIHENTPWIMQSVIQSRPFPSLDDLRRQMSAILESLPVDDKLALIRVHPDLVGRAALSGTLSTTSSAEQRDAGLGVDDLDDAEKSRFAEFNAAYQERFGFPFVICVRENRKQAILDAFTERLTHDRDTEIATAITEIDKIAWLRLTDIVIQWGVYDNRRV